MLQPKSFKGQSLRIAFFVQGLPVECAWRMFFEAFHNLTKLNCYTAHTCIHVPVQAPHICIHLTKSSPVFYLLFNL